MHVAVSDGPLYLRSWEAEFDHPKIDQLETFYCRFRLFKDAGDSLIGEALPDGFKGLLRLAKDVNCQPEWAGILAADFRDKGV